LTANPVSAHTTPPLISAVIASMALPVPVASTLPPVTSAILATTVFFDPDALTVPPLTVRV